MMSRGELNRFRNEPSMDKNENPLGWWKTKRLEYPTLTRLSKRFLCVPATTTHVERVFSWMGWLLNKRRHCLSGESVRRTIFRLIDIGSFENKLILTFLKMDLSRSGFMFFLFEFII